MMGKNLVLRHAQGHSTVCGVSHPLGTWQLAVVLFQLAVVLFLLSCSISDISVTMYPT